MRARGRRTPSGVGLSFAYGKTAPLPALPFNLLKYSYFGTNPEIIFLIRLTIILKIMLSLCAKFQKLNMVVVYYEYVMREFHGSMEGRS